MALVVVLAVVVGWFWIRTWLQARSLTQALQDIPGVSSVESAPDDATFAEHPYVLEFADDVTAGQLSKGVRAVDRVLDEHHIAGDRPGVQMRADGFVIGHSARYPLPPEVARAVVALREVNGLTGIDADDSEVTVSVRSETDLLPIGEKTLSALVDPELDTSERRNATRLRIVVADGGPFITAQLADVEGQLRLLTQLTDAANAVDALPARGDASSSSVSFCGATKDEGATCSARLRVGRDASLEDVSRTLIRQGPACITLMAEDGPTLNLGGERPDPARPLALRQELQKVGSDLVRADTSLSSVEVSVDDASSLEGLIRLTRDRDLWPAPAGASLKVLWGDGPWAVFGGDDITLLQENSSQLVEISRAGFLASIEGSAERPATVRVSSETEGAPDLTTESGREALVAALRRGQFEGRVRFSIEAADQPYTLAFTSTADGQAEDVQEPEDEYDAWSYPLVEAWNATAG